MRFRVCLLFFSSRRRHTSSLRDWSSDVCSSDLADVRDDVERSFQEGHPFTILVGARPIGRIGLNRFRPRDRICSLYLYVGEPEFRGKGHAMDAVMTLLAYAFERWDLHQVELWTLADNERAISMYEG